MTWHSLFSKRATRLNSCGAAQGAAIPSVLMMASVQLPGPSLTVSGTLGYLGGGYEGPTQEAHRRLDWAAKHGSANAAQRALREELARGP